MTPTNSYAYLEFFAGGGMVRQGLGNGWSCKFANDFDGKKALSYQENWGVNGELSVCDIRDIDPSLIDANCDLAWASFPCQDLSLAGFGKGLDSERSGMFFVFWDKLRKSAINSQMPKLVVIENVCGMLTSNSGQDFSRVIRTFVKNGYDVGGVVIDAKDFVPQSRKRVFIIGVRKDLNVDPKFTSSVPTRFHSSALQKAHKNLHADVKQSWLWYNLPAPNHRKMTLFDVLEPEKNVTWDSLDRTQELLKKMTPVNLSKVRAAQQKDAPTVGALFMRTRSYNGSKSVFAEVRFDGVSGCLRTPNGGSSRQSILWVHQSNIRSRLLTPRETARLMGLPEYYKLPNNRNTALHLTGDGVVVPVVSHLSQYLFEPLLSNTATASDPILVYNYL